MKTLRGFRRFSGSVCLWCVLIMGALALPSPVAAQACGTMLGTFNTWFKTQPQGFGTYYLAATAVTNRADGQYASYIEGGGGPGYLGWVPAHKVGTLTYPAYVFATNLVQYFSNRRYNPLGPSPYFPFNSGNTDSVGLQIFLTTSPPPPYGFGIKAGQVVLTLNTWGGTNVSFQGSCVDGMVIGNVQYPPTNVWTHFAISLQEAFFAGQ